MSDNSELDFQGVIEEADWSMLSPHNQRGALFLLSHELKLTDASKALARDDIELVKNWLAQGQLRKPTKQECDRWDEAPHEKLAKFVIVQPYVIMQLLSNPLQ